MEYTLEEYRTALNQMDPAHSMAAQTVMDGPCYFSLENDEFLGNMCLWVQTTLARIDCVPREVKDNHVMQEYTNTRKMGVLIEAERSLFGGDYKANQAGKFKGLSEADRRNTSVTRSILDACSHVTWMAPMRALYILWLCSADPVLTPIKLWRSLESIFMAALTNLEIRQIRKPAMWDAPYATEVAVKVTEMIENINQVCDPSAKESDYFMSFSVTFIAPKSKIK